MPVAILIEIALQFAHAFVWKSIRIIILFNSDVLVFFSVSIIRNIQFYIKIVRDLQIDCE